MDPKNLEYKVFSDYLAKRRIKPGNKWSENDMKGFQAWQKQIEKDKAKSHQFSAANIIMVRYLIHLLNAINCLICGSPENFGVHDKYCDNCLLNEKCYICPGPSKCRGKTSTYVCVHNNLARHNP